MPFFEGELLIGHPTFAEGSGAAHKDTRPVEISAPDIAYTVEDDEAIDAYNRKFGELKV
jgi:alcohol oxidase